MAFYVLFQFILEFSNHSTSNLYFICRNKMGNAIQLNESAISNQKLFLSVWRGCFRNAHHWEVFSFSQATASQERRLQGLYLVIQASFVARLKGCLESRVISWLFSIQLHFWTSIFKIPQKELKKCMQMSIHQTAEMILKEISRWRGTSGWPLLGTLCTSKGILLWCCSVGWKLYAGFLQGLARASQGNVPFVVFKLDSPWPGHSLTGPQTGHCLFLHEVRPWKHTDMNTDGVL